VSLGDAFAVSDAFYAAQVQADTWGHLAPKARAYPGVLTFARSEYNSGERVLLSARFEGLDDSPWLYDDLMDWLEDRDDLEEGAVYRWTGTYRKFKNGGCRFSGKTTTLVAAPPAETERAEAGR
jgi:hypothetical protein